jgi:hypothetical protein
MSCAFEHCTNDDHQPQKTKIVDLLETLSFFEELFETFASGIVEMIEESETAISEETDDGFCEPVLDGEDQAWNFDENMISMHFYPEFTQFINPLETLLERSQFVKAFEPY